MIQTITQNSGWNLLSDVLAKIDKAAKAIEDTLNTRFSGWDMTIESLKEKVEEYRKRSESAKRKVEAVKKSVESQKQLLISRFSQGIKIFAEGAKAKIEDEIEQIAESRAEESAKPKAQETPQPLKQTSDNVGVGGIVGEIGETLLEMIPVVGKGLGKIFKLGTSLLDTLINAVPEPFASYDSAQSAQREIYEPYKLKCKNRKEAQKIVTTINEFCTPHIQSWWLDTQDELVRDGKKIREELARRIQEDIQQISKELSDYLGDALQVELNINSIQFPSFDFQGIDAQIKRQQERVITIEKRKEIEHRPCNSDRVYYVDVPVEEKRSVFEVDLHQTAEAIKQKIDQQVDRSEELLQRVIEKQVSEDFRSAEQQINDYINRFQAEFDRLLRERETRETEADQIRATLEAHKAQMNEYLRELTSIQESLASWKPVQTLR